MIHTNKNILRCNKSPNHMSCKYAMFYNTNAGSFKFISIKSSVPRVEASLILDMIELEPICPSECIRANNKYPDMSESF